MECEFDFFCNNKAICWMVVSDNLRVKTGIPKSDLSDLELRSGDRFVWNKLNCSAVKIDEDSEHKSLVQEHCGLVVELADTQHSKSNFVTFLEKVTKLDCNNDRG